MSIEGQRSLYHTLHADQLPEYELRTLVSNHFSQGICERANEVDYYRTAPDESVTMVYDGEGNLTDVRASNSIDDAELDALAAAIAAELSSEGSEVGREVLYARVPTTKPWQYQDLIHLLPVPASAPHPAQFVADHPFQLEARYRRAADPHLNLVRGRRVLRRWELLLQLVLGYGIHAGSRYTTHRWTITKESDEPLVLTSQYLQEGYVFTGEGLVEHDFSRFDADPMQLIPDNEFFSRRGVSVDDTLGVPECMPRAVEVFVRSPEEEQLRFLRACYWFQLSELQWPISHSAAYVSLVQAVETLVSHPTQPVCSQCKRPLGGGATRAFGSFIDTYTAGTEKRDRDDLYGLRNAISHGGRIMSMDVDPGFSGILALSWNQQTVHDRMRHVCRIALINYLLTAPFSHLG